MKSKTALKNVDKKGWLIKAPAVGIFKLRNFGNAIVSGGVVIGKLKILNIDYSLILPEDVSGQIIPVSGTEKIYPVAYGQELFRLVTETTVTDPNNQIQEIQQRSETIVEGGEVICAFTNGIFYQKPAPDEPSFVTPGQTIEKGKVLGLIEVMKTFNQIVFQGIGDDDSQDWKIKKILVADSTEVKSGQSLFLLEKI